VESQALDLHTGNKVHHFQHTFQDKVPWRTQVLCHKAFPVNYEVCPKGIRLFSSYGCLQSSITAGHTATTVGTDANALCPVCVVFTHINVSVSETSPEFLCTCNDTFTKEKFLHNFVTTHKPCVGKIWTSL